MDETLIAAAALRERITAAKAHLAELYDLRAALMKHLAGTMTTREIADLFGLHQPQVVNTINGKRSRASREPKPPAADRS